MGMFLKYIQIGCKNLPKARDTLLQQFSFSVLESSSSLCLLDSSNFRLVLSQDTANRVTNVAFSTDSLEALRSELQARRVLVADKISPCPIAPLTPYIDVASPLLNVKHRIYEEKGGIEHSIDHVLCCCEPNTAHRAAQWYANFLNVKPYQFGGTDTGTVKVVVEGSGMEMFVNNPRGRDVPIFAFSEPITHDVTRFNQIERYLAVNGGSGIQHIALSTADIISTVHELRSRGVHVISQPLSYYKLPDKLAQFEEVGLDPGLAYENSIIVDRDKEGYLLQVFTGSVLEEGGMFFEVIQRKGCRGFGTGNVEALFKALHEDSVS